MAFAAKPAIGGNGGHGMMCVAQKFLGFADSRVHDVLFRRYGIDGFKNTPEIGDADVRLLGQKLDGNLRIHIKILQISDRGDQELLQFAVVAVHQQLCKHLIEQTVDFQAVNRMGKQPFLLYQVVISKECVQIGDGKGLELLQLKGGTALEIDQRKISCLDTVKHVRLSFGKKDRMVTVRDKPFPIV